MKRSILIKKITTASMLSALAYILALIAHFIGLNLVPGAPFLTYDPKDVIIVIGGFILGPVEGLLISLTVSFLEMITISTTGIYGFIMNVVSTCSLVIPASLIYHKLKSFKGALISLLVGYLSAILTMTLWNIIITPIYLNYDRAKLIQNLLAWIIIFNVIKDGVNIGAVLLLYKPLINGLRVIRLVDSNKKSMDKKPTIIMASLGVFLLVSFIIVVIILKK